MALGSTTSSDQRYRVFVSYSHDDEALASIVQSSLADRAHLMWDRSFRVGRGFDEQIKLYIAHAHVFLPLLTDASTKTGWVHQEIGFAAALNIPVLPIAQKGQLPGQMLDRLQAIVLRHEKSEKRAEIPEDWEKVIKNAISHDLLGELVERYDDPAMASLQCAELPEDRAKMMASYADDVRHLGYYGMVRQKGALSSFHIPKASLHNSIWKERYGEVNRTPYHCRLQREERVALEKHARVEGCRLIINTEIDYQRYGKNARRVRLQSLLEFLESDVDRIEIVIDESLPIQISQTFVGDWFSAEAISAQIGEGYYQTVFTRHAPSMRAKVEDFDCHFQELLSAQGLSPENSRARAIETLQTLSDELGASTPDKKASDLPASPNNDDPKEDGEARSASQR